jgi:hypothetical protein
MTDRDMTEHDHRLMTAGELAVYAELLPLITEPEAMLKARAMLRMDGRWPYIGPVQREQRGVLLDDLCRRLVYAGQGDPAYFVGVGDMFATSPDDASALDDTTGD